MQNFRDIFGVAILLCCINSAVGWDPSAGHFHLQSMETLQCFSSIHGMVSCNDGDPFQWWTQVNYNSGYNYNQFQLRNEGSNACLGVRWANQQATTIYNDMYMFMTACDTHQWTSDDWNEGAVPGYDFKNWWVILRYHRNPTVYNGKYIFQLANRKDGWCLRQDGLRVHQCHNELKYFWYAGGNGKDYTPLGSGAVKENDVTPVIDFHNVQWFHWFMIAIFVLLLINMCLCIKVYIIDGRTKTKSKYIKVSMVSNTSGDDEENPLNN